MYESLVPVGQRLLEMSPSELLAVGLIFLGAMMALCLLCALLLAAHYLIDFTGRPLQGVEATVMGGAFLPAYVAPPAVPAKAPAATSGRPAMGDAWEIHVRIGGAVHEVPVAQRDYQRLVNASNPVVTVLARTGRLSGQHEVLSLDVRA